MEAIEFIGYLQIFFATRAVLKIGEYPSAGGPLPGASIFHSDPLNHPCPVPLMGVFEGVLC